MADMTAMVKFGDQVVSLADLAGIDMSKVEAIRFENFPAGMFNWRLKSMGFFKQGEGEEAYAVCRIEHECTAVIAIIDPTEKAEKWIGKVQQETIFMHEPDALGRIRAFLEDIGHEAQPGLSYQQNFDRAVGIQYSSQIVKTPNKKNPDAEPYTNFRKRKPIVADAPVGVAAA